MDQWPVVGILELHTEEVMDLPLQPSSAGKQVVDPGRDGVAPLREEVGLERGAVTGVLEHGDDADSVGCAKFVDGGEEFQEGEAVGTSRFDALPVLRHAAPPRWLA